MSANVYWQPVKGRFLNGYAKSSFIQAFSRAFGEMPYTLTRSDLAKLAGCAAVWESRDENPFSELADALQDHDEIRVWAEY